MEVSPSDPATRVWSSQTQFEYGDYVHIWSIREAYDTNCDFWLFGCDQCTRYSAALQLVDEGLDRWIIEDNNGWVEPGTCESKQTVPTNYFGCKLRDNGTFQSVGRYDVDCHMFNKDSAPPSHALCTP